MTDRRKARKTAADASFSFFKKGHPIITMHGNTLVYIENFRRLYWLSSSEIGITVAMGHLVIRGTDLCILSFTPMEVQIQGRVDSISFQNREHP